MLPAAQKINHTSKTVPNVEIMRGSATAAPASSSAGSTPRVSFLITPPARRKQTPLPKEQQAFTPLPTEKQAFAPISRERQRPTPPPLPRSLARAIATHYVPRTPRARICSHGHITRARTVQSCRGCARHLGPFGWLYRCGMCGHKACGECGVHGRGWEGLIAIVELLGKRARGG